MYSKFMKILESGEPIPESIDNFVENEVLKTLYTSFVAEGRIDPRGKSDAEIKKEFISLALRFATQEIKYATTDYHEALLREARQHVRKGKREFACLFYATWFEHWINRLLMNRYRKISLRGDEAKILIRDCSLRAKYTCFSIILGMPRLAVDHINTVLRIAELRNAFVHYKYTPVDMNEWSNECGNWNQEFVRAERTVKYLQRYWLKHIHHDQKKKAKKIIGENPQ